MAMTIGKLKLNGQEQVIVFLEELKHPLKKEIEEVRKIILRVDKKITEHIKWNAPSFCYNGDDRMTLNLSNKDFFRIVFHCGAKVNCVKPKSRLFEDTTGLLEWAANDRAVMKFAEMEDVKSKKKALIKTVDTWLKLTTILEKK